MTKENPNYYSIITADVRYSKDLSCFEKLLYSDITALTNKNGYCNASNKYFAKVFNKTVRSITQAISNLVKHEFLESVLIKDDSNVIIERKLYLVSKIAIPVVKNCDRGIEKNCGRGIEKNYQYNNTSSINNINTEYKKNINTKKTLDLSLVGITDCDNVQLEQKEYDKLITDYNAQTVQTQIMQLDSYLEDHPRKYKSHYKALRSWLLKDAKTSKPKYETASEFNQRLLKEDMQKALVEGNGKINIDDFTPF
jgi:hypothetical protein